MNNLLWGLFAFAAIAHAQGTVTDIDGNIYDYLTYGTQQWTVENATMETYRDGTPIPQVMDATQWANLTTGAWCYYDNDPTKGKLYNWYAVAGIHDNDPNTPNKEFAPEGWHVPTDTEWTTLEEYLIANGYNYDGTTTGNKIAKSMASASGWLNSTNAGAPGNNQSLNNSSNFNILPQGYRNLNGVFYEDGFDGIVWSSTVDDPTHSWNRIIYSDQNSIIRNNGYSKSGSSVRFVYDNNTCSEVSINASATEVCIGESVDLSVDGLNSSSGVNTQSHSFTTGNYTRIPYTPHLYNLPQSTIEFWYYQESSSEEFIVATEYFNTGWGFHVENNGGSPRFLELRVSNGAARLGFDIPVRYEIPFNQWIHVAGVHDGSTVYLYVDGNLIDSAPYTGQIGDSYEDIVINRHTWASGSSERLNGKIDELRISNIARYTSNFTPPLYEFSNDSNTLALWHFNWNMQDESQYNTQSVTNGTNFSSNVPFGSYNFNSTDLLWSTGDTTETISVTPAETTEYWVDVTTNGVTCREYVTINVTAPAAPTGESEQTFCEASTVADLTATGDNIQWYDAATGGNLLDSTTALTDGQIVYASQTVNGCESTDRLEVTVSIQDITITATATEVCAGESVDLSVVGDINSTYLWSTGESNFSGQGTLIDEYSLIANTVSQNTFSTIPGNIYRLEVSGTISLGGGAGNQRDVAYYIQSGSDGTIEGTPFDSACNLRIWTSLFCDTPGLRPSPDIYDASTHTYNYPFNANSSTLDVGFWDSPLSDNGPNVVTFKLYELSNSESTITVSPTETTEYWVDVTTNGLTCREYVTINVTAPAAPTGESEQTFCEASTVADLTATGDNIQWYDAATGGNLLDSTTALTDGQIVYASQTVNGCESTDRLEVTVSIQDITITATATEVCAGESVDLSVVGDINSTYLWSTGESNFSGQGTLIDEYSLIANTVSQNTFSTIPGNIYRLEVSGTISLGGGAGNQRDVAYYIQSGSDGTIEGTPFDSACNLRIWTSLFCDTPGLRPSPDIYDASTHTYNYPFNANSSTLDVGFWDSPLSDNGPNVVTFKLYELSNSESTITVSPTETTEYWVDVTTNGLTCREYVTINVTAPAAPTGESEQTFCEASTVADLTATGDNIQWYDAATGGNLLDSTTALTDGQMVYASQTVNGCESTDRLEVTVSIQDITITATATEVCAGESSTLNAALTNASGTFAEGQLVNEFNHTINTNASQQFPTTVGLNYRLEIEGNVTWGTYCPALAYDPAYVLSGFYGTTEATPRDFACNDAMYSSIFCDSPGLRPIPDQYDGINHSYDYYFTANSNQISVGFFDNLLGDNCGSVLFRLFENSTPPSQNSLVWSTGDTTETISVTPTETTEYWVDVTTNGVTCREYVTISVNDLPEAPTGESVNYFINCDSFSPTLNDAIATLTGENIKLYDAAVGGNLLDPNSNIVDGQVVYASQILDSCESSDRLEVQLNLYTLEMPVTAAPNNTVSFCNEQNLTILELAPAQTATDRLWYETATSTIPIPETTPLVDGVTYYVSNYNLETGCESDRLAMTVEINNPEAPTGDAVQSFCDNVTVSDLSASGSNIQWYDAATGGNVLDPSSSLSDGQLLYASQTQNGCESVTRLEVSVEIDIIPDPILITTELEFCLAREATLADLEVDEQGFALEWYDSFSGGNMLPMDTLLEDGVSYYTTLYDATSGCESLMRLEVVPTVIPCEVVIYNAISLNDNGINDHMVIENAEYFPDNSLEVYNRDGHLLYSQTQYGIGGNLFRGKANVSGVYNKNSNLPTGSYLYVFKYFNPYEQQQYTLKGFLTINSN